MENIRIRPLINEQIYEDNIILKWAEVIMIRNNQLICNILLQKEDGTLQNFSCNRVFNQSDNNVDLNGMTFGQFADYLYQIQNPIQQTQQQSIIVEQNQQIINDTNYEDQLDQLLDTVIDQEDEDETVN